MAFEPGGAMSARSIEASRPLDEQALADGTVMRTVHLDSVRNDPPTMGYLRWAVERGARVRTAATLPLRMIIFDQKMALIPVNPDHSEIGAVVQRGPGMVAALCALFEQIWSSANPVGTDKVPGHDGLNSQERAIITLLTQGCTDEVIA